MSLGRGNCAANCSTKPKSICEALIPACLIESIFFDLSQYTVMLLSSVALDVFSSCHLSEVALKDIFLP